MITVRVHVTAKPSKERELSQAISVLKHMIKREQGCVSCEVYQRTGDEEEFVIIEEWESTAMAQVHMESGNMSLLAGAAAVLTREVRVALGQDPASKKLTATVKKKLSEKGGETATIKN